MRPKALSKDIIRTVDGRRGNGWTGEIGYLEVIFNIFDKFSVSFSFPVRPPVPGVFTVVFLLFIRCIRVHDREDDSSFSQMAWKRERIFQKFYA